MGCGSTVKLRPKHHNLFQIGQLLPAVDVQRDIIQPAQQYLGSCGCIGSID